MAYPLTDQELKNAHHRLRKEGCTRFQNALRMDHSANLLLWARSGVAPLERVDREGVHPFLVFLRNLHTHRMERGTAIKPMPEWWMKYAHWGGEQGWHQDQTEKRIAQEAADAELLPMFVAGIDWTRVDNKFKKALREALPSNLKLGAGEVVDQLMAAGLSLSPFKHQDMTMTMGMWSLCKWGRDSNVDFWLEREPIDPPGSGPGFLSVLLACWPLHKRHLTQSLPWIARASELGVDYRRPTLEAKEEKTYSFDEWILSTENRTNTTLLGQAQGLNDPELSRALVRIPETNCERLEVFLSAVKNMEPLTHQWISNADREVALADHLIKLEQVMPADLDRSTDRIAGDIRTHLLMAIAPRVPISRFPAMARLLERSLTQTGGQVRPLFTGHLEMAVEHAARHLCLEDAKHWLNLVRLHLSNKNTHTKLVESLTAAVFPRNGYYDADPDNLLGLLRHVTAGKPIGENEAISQNLFSKTNANGGVIYLRALFAVLLELGYRPNRDCWKQLALRLTPSGDDYGADRRDVIDFLAQSLLEAGVVPDSDAFAQIAAPIRVETAANKGRYVLSGSWGPTEIEAARLATLKIMAAACPDINARSGKDQMTPLESISGETIRAWRLDGNFEFQSTLANQLIQAGAIPNLDANASNTLAEDHPHWSIVAHYEQALLEQHTGSAQAPERRRLRL